MRKIQTLMLAAAAMAVSAPAVAQLGGAVGGVTGSVGGAVSGGVNTTVDPVTTTADTVGRTTDTVGGVVNKADSTVQSRVDNTRLSAVSAQDVTAGLKVRDSNGHSIGTVQSISGDQALVADGSKVYNVPVSQLYARGAGKARQLMTKVPRASLTAQANANANSAVKTGG